MYSCSWLPFEVKGGYEAFSLAVLRSCKSVFAYYSIFVFSGVMANIQAQGDRTNFLMLPASNLEKFSARLLYVVFLAFVPFVVGFLLADVLHMLTFPLFVGNGETVRTFLLPGLWDVKAELKSAGQEFLDLVHLNIDLSSFVCALVIFSLVESLWRASFYILGGCYWRKLPFVKTFTLLMLVKIVVILALGISYVMIVREVEAPVEAAQIWMDRLFMGISQGTLLLICAGVFFVWALLNFYGAYRLFCHRQVVEPKRISL